MPSLGHQQYQDSIREWIERCGDQPGVAETLYFYQDKNLAILQTIVATCITNDINPQDYIEDVLLHVQTHPDSRIDELLPMNWRPVA